MRLTHRFSTPFTCAVVAVLCGCGGGGEPEPGSGCGPLDEPTLEVGTGLREFVPLQPGEELPLIRGPQGGVHLELSLRATGIDAADLLNGELFGDVNGVRVATVRPWVDFRCNKQVDALDAIGIELVYDADPPDLYGLDTLVTARVTDMVGPQVTASIDLVLTPE